MNEYVSLYIRLFSEVKQVSYVHSEGLGYEFQPVELRSVLAVFPTSDRHG